MSNFPTNRRFPDAGGVISTRNHVFSIWTERDREYKIIVCHPSYFLACSGFPNTRSSISASGNHILAIRTESNGEYWTTMSHARHFLASGGFPDAGRAVFPT